MEYLKHQTKDTISDKDVKTYLQELFFEADNININNLQKKKNDENYLKDLIEILRIKENKIINCITQIDEIQIYDEEVFKDLVANRKEKNKETKLNNQKDKQKECIQKYLYKYFVLLFNIFS